jgi:histidinol dehydrogenase
MNAVPARVAGVKRIVMVTPPGMDSRIAPLVLVAACEAGITEIYRVGGAQAIAALAFGTASIAKVDKIVGPGNIYVAMAKRQVYGYVDIDMVAGPSEILVLADESANPAWVAADLLSQAEHDPLAAAVLITTSSSLATAVAGELEEQLAILPRRRIAEQSLHDFGGILLVDHMDDAMAAVNRFAPEHLELAVSEPMTLLGKVENAGAIFLGHHSPEAFGDYLAGPNHVLPTARTARFSSPLSVHHFQKTSSIIHCSEAEMRELAPAVVQLAQAEGLDGHARSALCRLDDQASKGEED